jgi:hypothetical protein
MAFGTAVGSSSCLRPSLPRLVLGVAVMPYSESTLMNSSTPACTLERHKDDMRRSDDDMRTIW